MKSVIFGIKEVMNLTLYYYNPDLKKRIPICHIDYAQATGLEHSANRTEIRGGWGNSLLITFDDSKNNVMNLTLPLVDLRLLSAITGDKFEEELGILSLREVKTVQDGGTGTYIVLKREPLNNSLRVNEFVDEVEGKSFEVVDRGNKNPDTGKCSIVIEQDEVRLYFKKSDVPVDSQIVASYFYQSTEKVGTFRYQTSTSPGFISMDGVAKFRNKVTGKDELFNFTGYKCQFRPDYNITFSATDPTVLELQVDFLAYTEKETGISAYYKLVEYDTSIGEGTITVTNVGANNTITLKANEKFVIATKEENVELVSATSNNSKFTVSGLEITGVAPGTGKVILKKHGYKDKEITVTVTQ